MKSANKHIIEGRQILEDTLLSEGAYGYIYKAHDIQSGQIYALKKMFCQVYHNLYQKGQERTAVAQNELNILKKLPNHPNIVSFFGGQLARNDQGITQALMLMEFCSGGSLFDLMAKNPNDRFQENQIINIVKDVVQGLKAMHALNPSMAHRDIKIENILCQDGIYKLCDFGSSSVQKVDFNKIDKKDFFIYEEEYEKNTTLMYRPPEMADLYQRYEVTEKVDVWMLGCVVFTLCFFIHPFQECSKLAIVNAAYNFPKHSTYSEKLHDLIRVMLTPNPKLRPSINEIAQLILNFKSIQHIQLNSQALEIKNRENILEKEMEIYQQNSDKVKHFVGDIPFDELIKLQQKIKQESGLTQKTHVRPASQNINNNFQQKNMPKVINQQDIWGSFETQSQHIPANTTNSFETNWECFSKNSFEVSHQPQWNQKQQEPQSQIDFQQPLNKPIMQNKTKELDLMDMDLLQVNNEQVKNNSTKIDLTNIVL